MQDMMEKGRHKNIKLNLKKANEIRNKHTNGVSVIQLVKEYNISDSQIHRILNNERWKN